MPSIMEATAVGLRADMTSKAPLLILTSSESRTHRAVVSWQPPVMAHTAPTASPLPTCMHELQLLGSSRADAQHTQATFSLTQPCCRKSGDHRAACVLPELELSTNKRNLVMPGKAHARQKLCIPQLTSSSTLMEGFILVSCRTSLRRPLMMMYRQVAGSSCLRPPAYMIDGLL